MIAASVAANIIGYSRAERTPQYFTVRAGNIVVSQINIQVLIGSAGRSATCCTGIHKDAAIAGEAERALRPVIAGTAISRRVHRIVLNRLLVCAGRVSSSVF